MMGIASGPPECDLDCLPLSHAVWFFTRIEELLIIRLLKTGRNWPKYGSASHILTQLQERSLGVEVLLQLYLIFKTKIKLK